MIVMSVRHKDAVRLDLFDIHHFCEWVLSNKWVKEQVFPIDFGGKAGVAVVNNFHAILFCVLKPNPPFGSRPKVIGAKFPTSDLFAFTDGSCLSRFGSFCM